MIKSKLLKTANVQTIYYIKTPIHRKVLCELLGFQVGSTLGTKTRILDTKMKKSYTLGTGGAKNIPALIKEVDKLCFTSGIGIRFATEIVHENVYDKAERLLQRKFFPDCDYRAICDSNTNQIVTAVEIKWKTEQTETVRQTLLAIWTKALIKVGIHGEGILCLTTCSNANVNRGNTQ